MLIYLAACVLIDTVDVMDKIVNYSNVDNREIIASSGTREGGLVQTGIIAMNTLGSGDIFLLITRVILIVGVMQ